MSVIFTKWLPSVAAPHPADRTGIGNTTMTTAEHQHPPRRTIYKPIVAALWVIALAASMVFGTAVGPASAETAAQLIYRVCGNYDDNPISGRATYCPEKSFPAGADLTSATLAYANLYRTYLTDANLTGANLIGANLAPAGLVRANLTNANLTDADLTGSNLLEANLTGANLAGANLTDAFLLDATLTNANLRYANLTNADLTGTDLRYADLTGADLTGARMNATDLTGAKLTDAELYRADLANANLTDANLDNASLDNADLATANLTGANLSNSYFRGANLTNTILTGTSAIPANITVTTESTDGAPVTWATPVMPTGLTFGGCDSASGTVFHVYLPTATVTCTVTSTFNGAPTTGFGTFTVKVVPLFVAPAFTNPPQAPLKAGVGLPFTYTFDVTGKPEPTLALTVYNRPDWFTLTGRTLTGTPDAAGSYSVTITARNGYDPYGTVLNFTIEVTAETPVQTIARVCGSYVPNPTLASFTDCSGKDLTAAQLSDVNLNYANLTNANLTDANLKFAKLTNAKLTNSKLTNAPLDGANLTNANLDGANLTNANLYFANLTDASLDGANLTNANLTRTYLTDATLDGANLTNAILTDADLTGSSLIPADINATATSADGATVAWASPAMPTGLAFGACAPASGTVFPVGRTNVNCTVTSVAGGIMTTGSGIFTITVAPTGTIPEIILGVCGNYIPNPTPDAYTNCSGADFTYANLTGANLSYANLEGANLTSANLTGATLTKAKLTKALLPYADLTGANLYNANLYNSVLGSANLYNANLNYVNLNWVNLYNANLTGVTLIGSQVYGSHLYNANLTGANLTNVDLRLSHLDGANLTGTNLTGTKLTGTTFDDATIDGATLTGTSAIPADITASAESAGGALATWTSPTMPTGLVFGDCTPASGILFPVGPTIVTCTVAGTNDGALTRGSGTFTVTVDAVVVAPAFTDTAPVTLSGTVGTELPHTFTVTGTPTPQINVTAGELPDGLTLSAAGVLSGIPTTPGPVSFTITAANGTTPDATMQVNGTINPAPETPAQIIARVCGNYVPNPTPASFTDCSGKDLTGTNLYVANLTSAKLTDAKLDSANLTGANLTDANLDGATLTGANLEIANLTNANLTSANLTSANLTSAKLNDAKLTSANLTSANLLGAKLTRADMTNAKLTGTTLDDATIDGATLTGTSAIPADVTLTATSADGTAATWTTPTMPTGLVFGDCTPPSGTLFPVGSTTVTCTVAGTYNGALTRASGTFTVAVNPAAVAPAFADTTAVQLNGVIGTVLTRSFPVTGNPAPVVTVVDPAKLPPGMTFTDETLTGTPTTTGVYPFTLKASNSTTSDAALDVTVTVVAAPTAPAFTDSGAVTLNGIVGTDLNHTFAVTGNPVPTVTATGLPTELTLSPTGVLTGTPTNTGAFPFTVTATNGVGNPATLNVVLEVDAAPAAPMFTDAGPVTLTAVVGTALTRGFAVTGNPTPTITVVDPSKLPTGMTFADGVLTGTPTVASTYTFTLKAANGINPDLTLEVTVNVTGAPVVDPPTTGSLGSLESNFGS